jgi:hypothetical protein
MIDTVNSLLNNAVDLYVQAVEYRRIPTLVGAGIRQIMPESSDIWQPSPNFGGTVPDFGQTVWILDGAAGSSAIWPGYWPNLRPIRSDHFTYAPNTEK